jgi:uncharacterized protein (DUF488 family)
MKQKALYTIGYEDATVDALIARLESAGVRVLIDVRAIPLSRKPGYSKNRLAERLDVIGIEYIGLKGLGTPAAGREAARRGRTEEMRTIFRQHLKTKEAQADMQRGLEIVQKSPACLLCFEHAPGSCHRMIIADVMAKKTGMAVIHLDPCGPC